jgi:hypothetical protein
MLPIRRYFPYRKPVNRMCYKPSIVSLTVLFAMSASLWLAGVATAEPPRKPTVFQFNALIERSPFTIRPTSSGSTPSSPLEREWMLGSIRPNGEGWSVTLINKKNRKDRVRLIPGFAAGGFQLLDVKQDPQSAENSRVRVSKGSQTAWIGYDESLIKVRPPAKSKVQVRPSITPRTTGTTKRAVPPTPSRTSIAKPRTRYVPKDKR